MSMTVEELIEELNRCNPKKRVSGQFTFTDMQGGAIQEVARLVAIKPPSPSEANPVVLVFE